MRKIAFLTALLLAACVGVLMAGCGGAGDAGKEFSVTFDLGYECQDRVFSQTAYEKLGVNEPKVSRQGYSLVGWFEKDAAGNLSDAPFDFFAFRGVREMTLVAVWEKTGDYSKTPKNLSFEMDGDTVTITADAEQGQTLEYAVNDGEYSEDGVFTLESGTHYKLKARFKGYASVAETDVVTAPDSASFEITKTENAFNSLTVTPKDQKDYEYSADGVNWTDDNVLGGLSPWENTVCIRIRIKGSIALPASFVLTVTAEVEHSYEYDFEYIVASTASQGFNVKLEDNTAAAGLNGEKTHDGNENLHSLKMALERNSEVYQSLYVNSFFNVPDGAMGLIFDMKVDGGGADGISVIGNNGGRLCTVKGDGAWRTVITIGDLMQLQIKESAVIYLDNVRFYTQEEYSECVSALSLSWGNDTDGGDYANTVVTANTLFIDPDGNLAPKIEMYGIPQGKTLAKNILFNKTASDGYVELKLKYVRADGASEACLTAATSRGESFGVLNAGEWVTLRLKTYYTPGGADDLHALLQFQTDSDVTVYVCGIKTQTEAEKPVDNLLEWGWNG